MGFVYFICIEITKSIMVMYWACASTSRHIFTRNIEPPAAIELSPYFLLFYFISNPIKTRFYWSVCLWVGSTLGMHSLGLQNMYSSSGNLTC